MSSPGRAAGPGPLRLEPFRALRYGAGAAALADVTLAPPALWDFAALGGLARGQEHHVLRLLSPSLTSDPDSAVTAPTESAERTATRWLDEGALVAEPPALWSWRWTEAGRSVVGVAGALRLPAAGVVPHEEVRPGLVAHRAAELGSGRVQPEPIMLLYDGDPELVPAEVGEPTLDLRLTDAEHRVSRIDDPERRAEVDAALAGRTLVVADGHHRFRVLGSLPAPRPRAFVLVVDVRRSQLTVGPIPRVVPGLAWEAVTATPGARLVDIDDGARDAYLAAAPPGRLRWVVADSRRTVGFELDWDATAGLGPAGGEPCGPVARDVCALHVHLLPAWGIDSDRVRYAHTWSRAREDAAGADGLAVEARAPDLADVVAAAAGGTLLPHKATSIAPKPRAGLLLLDDRA